MRLKELIQSATSILEQEGDMEVGNYNQEFCCFDTFEKIYVKKSDRRGLMSDDDEELGNKFLAIGRF